MSIHRSHICHIGGADQGLFSSAPKIPAPRIIASHADQANDRLRWMIILAVLEGGLPACQKAIRTANPSRRPVQPARTTNPLR